jgi:hypothetical protein
LNRTESKFIKAKKPKHKHKNKTPVGPPFYSLRRTERTIARMILPRKRRIWM